MLRRLFMVLLIACLAAPALAMPVHCGPVAEPAASLVHHGMDHAQHHKAPANPQPSHDCIGCIAPASASTMLPEPPMAIRPMLSSMAIAFRALTLSGPETPPPRP